MVAVLVRVRSSAGAEDSGARLAIEWSRLEPGLPVDSGTPVMVLDAERLVAAAARLDVPLDGLMAVVVLHEVGHLSKRHVSDSRGGDAVGGWDAEVEAQALAHEALLRLLHRNDENQPPRPPRMRSKQSVRSPPTTPKP